MKEYVEIKCLSDMLDVLNYKDLIVIQQGNVDLIVQYMKEKEKLVVEIQCLKEVRVKNLSVEVQKLVKLFFSCVIIKKEQVDMGILKKVVCGIVVVYLMIVLGCEMGLKEVIGYVKKVF